jgi:hypothetical protein
MMWMVHRLSLNDPTLLELDFSTYGMPGAEEEPRIAPKLFASLGSNRHLRRLLLEDCNLRGGVQVLSLGVALAGEKCALQMLDVSSNFLEPIDLRHLFSALARNTTLEELRCGNQFCDPADWDAYNVLANALGQNGTLRRLGMYFRDAHWRDQISRALVRNTDAVRRRRRQERRDELAQMDAGMSSGELASADLDFSYSCSRVAESGEA